MIGVRVPLLRMTAPLATLEITQERHAIDVGHPVAVENHRVSVAVAVDDLAHC